MQRSEWFPMLEERYPDWDTFSEIEHTFRRIDEIFRSHACISISVSGGSDSDCVMHLICTYFPEYLYKCHFVFVNTGLEYDATKRHLEEAEHKYGVTIDRVRGKSVVYVVAHYGLPILSKYKANIIKGYLRDAPWTLNRLYPPDELRAKLRNDQVFSPQQLEMVEYLKANGIKVSAECCMYSKKKPLLDYEKSIGADLYVTGERKAEGGQRSIQQRGCFSERDKGPNKFMPLWAWSHETKRQFKAAEGIRYSDCYEIWGFRRTGCVGCPFNIRIAEDLQAMAQFEPKMYKACMHVFGQAYELMDRFNCRKRKCLPEVIQYTIFGECAIAERETE